MTLRGRSDGVTVGGALATETFRVGKLDTANYSATGPFPIVDQGQAAVAGYTDRQDLLYDGPLPAIVFGDHTRAVKLVTEPFVAGADGTKILIPDPRLFDPVFFYFALTALKIPARGYNRHWALLRELTIPRPPLDEQRRIARILSTIERSRRSYDDTIRALVVTRQAVIERAFSGAPEAVALEALIQRPQYGFTASAAEGSGARFLRITDLRVDGVDWASVPACRPEPPSGDRYALHDGDLVVARIGATTGKAWLVRDPPAAVFASYLIRLRVLDGSDPRYIAAFFESATYWRQIQAAKGGRLKGGVNIGNLASLQIPVIDGVSQQVLGDQLDCLGTAVDAHRAQRNAVDRLFASALEYFLGSDR